jgi:seryl-tRNA synthetase
MHDVRLLRERPDDLREAMRRRGALDALAPQIDRFLRVDQERRLLQQAVDERKAARNAISQEVAQRKRAKEPAEELIAKGREMGEEIARLDQELAAAERAVDAILYEIPNVPLPDVPEGGEDANVIVRSWGTPRPSEGVRPHWEIAAAHGLFDIERGAKISGSGFVAYRGQGARLVRALLNFFLDSHADLHGYEEVWPPALVNRASMTGTGQLPKFEDDAYRIADDELFLIPTAEVPVTNLYRDEELPAAIRMTRYGKPSPWSIA